MIAYANSLICMESADNTNVQAIVQQDAISWVNYIPKDITKIIIEFCINSSKDERELGKIVAAIQRINKSFYDIINKDPKFLKFVFGQFENIKQQFFADKNLKYAHMPMILNKNGKSLFAKTNLLKKIKNFSEEKIKFNFFLDGAKSLFDYCQDNEYLPVWIALSHMSNFSNLECQSILRFASKTGNKEIVKFLIDNKANLDQPPATIRPLLREIFDHTPLMHAAMNNHEEIVQMLVDGGAKINCIDKNGHNAYILACQSGHKKITAILAEQEILKFVTIFKKYFGFN